MTVSLKEIPPVVVMPITGGGKVEISVVNDSIWISDYSSDDVCNFTLRVMRGKLEGSEYAREAVHEMYKRRKLGGPSAQKGAPAHEGNRGRREALAKFAETFAAGLPSKAGYWFSDPTVTPHGGPVVVLDP